MTQTMNEEVQFNKGDLAVITGTEHTDEAGLGEHFFLEGEVVELLGEYVFNGGLAWDCRSTTSSEAWVVAPGDLLSLDDTIGEPDGFEGEVDMVTHPPHYTSHPSGVECIQITRHMGFNLGNAFKYIWRCDLKRDAIEDLRKAIFYIEDEIKMRENQTNSVH